jgi:hypothetical protein
MVQPDVGVKGTLPQVVSECDEAMIVVMYRVIGTK